MPENEFPKLKLHPYQDRQGVMPPEAPDAAIAPPYAELCVTSNYTFLTGASHPEEFVQRAAALGYRAVALTDTNTLAGVVRAHVAAKDAGLRFVLGCRLRLLDLPGVSLFVYPTDMASYGRLCRLLTTGKRRAPKGQCHLRLEGVEQWNQGLLAIVELEGRDACNGRHGCGSEQPCLAPEDQGPAQSQSPHAASRWIDSEEGIQAARHQGIEPEPEPLATLSRLRRIFDDDRLSLALRPTYGAERGLDDATAMARTADLSRAAGVPLCATNGPHCHVAGRRMLQDVLTCIRHTCTLAQAGFRLHASAERHLKPPDEMLRLFAAWPGAIDRALRIVARTAGFTLDDLRYEYPDEVVPEGTTPQAHLAALTWKGAADRYPPTAANRAPADTAQVPDLSALPDKVRKQIEHELALIDELGYARYFLTVHDLVRFAREEAGETPILCQGRGAAANSAVCYCLGVTSVDPSRIDVLFERFISRERNEPPDIDIDFEHERREEVIQYIYKKYGRDRAALTAEVISYRRRSAVRDVGKALGLSLDTVDRLAKSVDWWDAGVLNGPAIREMGLNPEDPTLKWLARLTAEILGFPRHLSQHVGGFVITRKALCELVPVENAAMPDRTVIEWDKDDIDAMGMLKVDCLGLGMLTALRKCLDFVNGPGGATGCSHGWSESSSATRGSPVLIEPPRGGGGVGSDRDFDGVASPLPGRNGVVCARSTGFASEAPAPPVATTRCPSGTRPRPSLALHTIPPEDPAVYAMIQKADTVGVFQIESRAQMSMLPRLRPACFYDLVIEVAIVRPGPIQGDMVHPYLRRRNGEEDIPENAHPAFKEVLGKTLGVPLFQEQCMALAVKAAGFTPGEADQLRRAMAAWKRKGDQIVRFGRKLIDGMMERGIPREFAQRCFEQIKGFSSYGFPESHAASFALLVYASAWLKCHHPAEFTAALINSLPMGFYAPAQLVRDAREHGVVVREIDVNQSVWDCSIEASSPGWRANVARGFSPRFAREEPSTPKGSTGGVTQSVIGRPLAPEVGSLVDPPGVEGSLGVNQGLKPLATFVRPPGEERRPSIRLGMRLITGLSQAEADKVAAAVARRGPFDSMLALWRASGVKAATMRRLAAADAFGSMGLSRQQALWNARLLRDDHLPLFDAIGSEIAADGSNAARHDTLEEDEPNLPDMGPQNQVVHDYNTTGLSLKRHPVWFARERLVCLGCLPCEDLRDPAKTPDAKAVMVAGLVLVRQRPGTASGVTFITLEDETGIANLVIWRQVYDRFRRQAGARLLVARGKVQRQGEVVHVVVMRLRNEDAALDGMDARSRDFR